jgi:hypothetical protein
LPRKAREPEKLFALKRWRVIAAFSAVAILLSGLAVYATENYNQAQVSIAAGKALEVGESQIEEITKLVNELEQTIRDADQIAFEADGRTLDEQALEDLIAEIEDSKQVWVDQKTKLMKLEAADQGLLELRQSDGRWTRDVVAFAEYIEELVNSDWTPVIAKISSILEKSSSTQAAQGLWLKEQDRIAAEKAAAEAAAKAAADELARKASEPTSLAAPEVEGVQCTKKSEAEYPAKKTVADYILAIAPNAITTWECDVCAPGTFCGRAYLPRLESFYEGPPQTTEHATVVVLLDEDHIDLYLSEIGLSILVHEAAHARQHVKYGTYLIRDNEIYTGLVGTAAVEYMADCATIVKLGYSTGAYTQSCTPDQLEAAATIW